MLGRDKRKAEHEAERLRKLDALGTPTLDASGTADLDPELAELEMLEAQERAGGPSFNLGQPGGAGALYDPELAELARLEAEERGE